MRTVDPELWYKKLNKATTGPSARETGRYGPIERRLRASFNDAVGEFWRHTTMPGLRYVLDIDARKHTRWCHGLLMLSLVVWGLATMTYVSVDFQSRPPLQINHRSKDRDSVVPFPAIAICSNAIITHRALKTYTDFLSSRKRNNNTYSYNMIKNNLMKFGNLITLNWPEPDMEFMRFVYDMDPNFNVTNVMYKFAPRCTHILRRCGWRGHTVECDRLFAERPTPFGFCCVFNSRYQPADIQQPPLTLRLLGPNNGLVVVVNENPDDAAVSRRPTAGFDVLMFDGNQYPLIQAGLVRLLPVSRNQSVYFPLQAHVQHPSSTLRVYNEEWRRCRLRQMEGKSRNEFSSYTWCLTECRQRTIFALCHCLPFTLLPNANDKTCTPEHLTCLTKHREKLLYYYPGGSDPRLDKERQDSQMCLHCVPDCAREWHTTVPYHTQHYYPKKLARTMYTTGVSLDNTTILRFYYDSIHHIEFNVEINIRFFEAFAKISCQARLLVGLSLLTVSELVFFLTIRWGYHFVRRSGTSATGQRFDHLE